MSEKDFIVIDNSLNDIFESLKVNLKKLENISCIIDTKGLNDCQETIIDLRADNISKMALEIKNFLS